MPTDPHNAATLVTLCSTEDAVDFGALRIEPEGMAPVAVFHHEGEFFVTDDTCTHGEASLSEGTVENGSVECPWHSGRFCLKTGVPQCFPAEIPIRIHKVVVKDGQVCIPRTLEPA